MRVFSYVIGLVITSELNSAIQKRQSDSPFNPIDKLIEVYEANKNLYEQLLASEREKIEILKQKS